VSIEFVLRIGPIIVCHLQVRSIVLQCGMVLPWLVTRGWYETPSVNAILTFMRPGLNTIPYAVPR